jgi:hypothetical protein
MADLDDALDELAGVPPRRFGAARRAIVARLQQAGRSAAAARLKALRAPTVPVWAVNRLVRQHPALVDRLITAAGRVRAAQLGRPSGGDGLAARTAQHGEVLGELLARARAILDEAGVRGTHRMLLRVQTTLAAAAADPERQRDLRAGRLDRELGAQGFDVFAGARLPERKASAPAGASAPGQRAAPPAARARADDDLQARAAAERASRAAAEEADRRARLAREIDARREAAEGAARVLTEAREQLARAREGVRVAVRNKRAADRALSQVSRPDRRRGRGGRR